MLTRHRNVAFVPHALVRQPDDPEPQSNASMQTLGRTPVIGPQGTCTLSAACKTSGERMTRAMRAKGGAANLLGPPAAEDDDVLPRQGLVLLHRLVPGGAFRKTLPTQTQMPAISCSNGVDCNEELGVPAVAQTDVHQGNQQITVKVNGHDTIVQFGEARVEAGDPVMVDPCPVMVRDLRTGELLPAVTPPVGMPKTQQCFGVVPCGPGFLATNLNGIKNLARAEMATKSFADSLSKCTSAVSVRELMNKRLQHIFTTKMRAAKNDPIRPYVELWAIQRLYCTLCVEDCPDAPDLPDSDSEDDEDEDMDDDYAAAAAAGPKGLPKLYSELKEAEDAGDAAKVAKLEKEIDLRERPAAVAPTNKLIFWALQASVLVMREIDDVMRIECSKMSAMLPHDNDPVDGRYGEKRRQSGLHSKLINGLVSDNVHARASWNAQHYRAAHAHVFMLVTDQLETLVHMRRNHLSRFYLGMALSSADKGQAFDIDVGRAM